MIRVAFVGAGMRAVSHMVDLAGIPDVEIVSMMDLSEEACRKGQAHANARLAPQTQIAARMFTNFQAMLDAVEFDCLYLGVPPFAHGDPDIAAIEAGKPLFIEKPVALDPGFAREIDALIRQRGLINAVGYQMRYGSPVQQVRTMLQGVPIGMAVSIRIGGLPGTPWWRVQSKSGGMLIEQHTHAVDLMRYLCGEIESVYAVGATRLLQDTPDLDIYDVNACTVRFADGMPGMIGNSCGSAPSLAVFPPHLVHVITRDALFSVNADKTTIRREGAEPEELSAEEPASRVMNRAFIDAVRSGSQAPILSDYSDALRTLEVTYACQRSAETGKVIEL